MLRRNDMLAHISNQSFDLCVIGGGATGGGCALDAQLRGLNTLLIDAGDFASATSSASTKLVHGGVRYLQEAIVEFDPGQYRVVKRALHERRIMLDNAPHLAHPLHFVVPCHTTWEAIYYVVGLKLYEAIAGRGNLFPSRYLSRQQTARRMPLLNPAGLRGSVTYADGQFDDARFALSLVNSFTAAGGAACNYLALVSFQKDGTGRISSAVVRDQSTGKDFALRARAFLNATGPFSDALRHLANPALPNRLRLSRGVHVLLPLPPAGMESAILVPNTDDGRVIFAIPWLGRLLVGTTDTEISEADSPFVTREEAEFLLRQLNRYLSQPYQAEQIVSAFAGVRPLVAAAHSENTKKLIREHEVEVDSMSGLISVLGGKWTTYRAMAQDGIDAVERQLGMRVTASTTAGYRLDGSRDHTPDFWHNLTAKYQIAEPTARHLAEKFGSHASDVLALASKHVSLLEPLVAGLPPVRAEVVYAVQQEMALTLEDVLARRIGLQFFGWSAAREAAGATADLMAPLLGWSAEDRERAVAEYTARVSARMRRIGLESGEPLA